MSRERRPRHTIGTETTGDPKPATASPEPEPTAVVEPAPEPARTYESPIELGPSLELARLGFELATLLLAVPRVARSAATVSRLVVDMAIAGGGRWSDEGLERMLVLQAVSEWLDAERNARWEVDHFELRRGHGEYVVSAEDKRTGEAFLWVVPLRDYRVSLASETLREAWRLDAARGQPKRVSPADVSLVHPKADGD